MNQFDFAIFTDPAVIALIAWPLATFISTLLEKQNIRVPTYTFAIAIALVFFAMGRILGEAEKSLVVDLINVIVGILGATGAGAFTRTAKINMAQGRLASQSYRSPNPRPWWDRWPE